VVAKKSIVPSTSPSPPPNASDVVTPSEEALATFKEVAKSLQRLSEFSNDMYTPSRPSKIPTRLVALILQRTHNEVVRRSGFPSSTVMAHNLCETYPERLELGMQVGPIPKKARLIRQVLLRVVQAFGSVPHEYLELVGIVRSFFFSECSEAPISEVEKAAKELVAEGQFAVDESGAYIMRAGAQLMKGKGTSDSVASSAFFSH
jgi:hypothetical protein